MSINQGKNSPSAKNISAIFFDWGDTLMYDSKHHTGPMLYWPEVYGVPGVETMLDTLSRIYPLYLATNAADSNALLVIQCLERLNLHRFFKQVFTSVELGSQKPDPIFFSKACEAAGWPAGQCVYIGNDVGKDVIPARQAGMKTILFNENRDMESCLDSDCTVHALADIPIVLVRL